MIQDQCISVTDLRTKTKECMENLETSPKYIFINNKPVAVLIDIIDFEENFTKPNLFELSKNEMTPRLKRETETARKAKKSDLINI